MVLKQDALVWVYVLVSVILKIAKYRSTYYQEFTLELKRVFNVQKYILSIFTEGFESKKVHTEEIEEVELRMIVK